MQIYGVAMAMGRRDEFDTEEREGAAMDRM